MSGVILFAQEKNTIQDHNPDLRDYYPKRFISKFEVFGGPNVSWFWGDESLSDRVGRVGYSAGVGFYHTLSRHLDINLKIYLDQKGSKVDYDGISYDDPDNPNIFHNYRYIQAYELSYFTFSVLLQYYFGKHKKIFLGSGFSASYLGKSVTWTKFYREGVYIQYYRANDINAYKKYDVGIAMTIGYNIYTDEKIRLYFQLLNNLSLLNIRNPDIPATTLKNNVITFMVGIILNNKLETR